MQLFLFLLSEYSSYILLFLVAMNLLAVLVYWYDKQAAISGDRRVSENDLLLIAIVGGSIGATIACQAFRHKTKKQPFAFQLFAIFVLQVALVCGLISGWIMTKMG